jgi:3-oxoadipate enol-lactonase
MVESTSAEGFSACCEALREADFRESISAIRVPTLVISGTHDSGTPPADGKFLAKQIPGARYVELDAAHLLNIEQRDRFTQEVSDFLRESRVSSAS